LTPTDPVQRILGAVPPASGAAVMGTGIVSIGLALDGRETLSRILLVICAAAWVILGVVLGVRLLCDPERVGQEAHSPAALTAVAGTEVLGSRLTLLGWDWAGIALLVIALVVWLTLLSPVLTRWVVPTIGVSFVLPRRFGRPRFGDHGVRPDLGLGGRRRMADRVRGDARSRA
jgi:tellurite resistance protein TehA-like permease